MGVRFFTYVFYSFVFFVYIHVIIIFMCHVCITFWCSSLTYCSSRFSKQYKLFLIPRIIK